MTGLKRLARNQDSFYSQFHHRISFTTMAPEIDPDPFDDLLSLEDKFHKEGYDLGITDGDREGLIEGRLFGLKQGFEKYAAMGKLHGRAMIWAGRLPSSKAGTTVHSK